MHCCFYFCTVHSCQHLAAPKYWGGTDLTWIYYSTSCYYNSLHIPHYQHLRTTCDSVAVHCSCMMEPCRFFSCILWKGTRLGSFTSHFPPPLWSRLIHLHSCVFNVGMLLCVDNEPLGAHCRFVSLIHGVYFWCYTQLLLVVSLQSGRMMFWSSIVATGNKANRHFGTRKCITAILLIPVNFYMDSFPPNNCD